jgi:hypothetical protein
MSHGAAAVSTLAVRAKGRQVNAEVAVLRPVASALLMVCLVWPVARRVSNHEAVHDLTGE